MAPCGIVATTMAATTVMTALHCSIAGVTGQLATLLTGKTIAGAVDDLDAIAAAALANGIAAGGLVSYTINGQTGTINYQALNDAIRALKAMARTTGGPVMLPIEFGS